MSAMFDRAYNAKTDIRNLIPVRVFASKEYSTRKTETVMTRNLRTISTLLSFSENAFLKIPFFMVSSVRARDKSYDPIVQLPE